MKKLLLLFVLSFFMGTFVNAQCIPDPQYSSPGIYPDSASGFSSGCVDDPYEQLVTVFVAADTTLLVGPFPVTLVIDSLKLTGITGLPAGFTYSCYDSQNMISAVDGCVFEGNTIGCILISGTPTASDIGVHPLSLQVELYLEGGGTPAASENIDYYQIEISNCGLGLVENNSSKIKLFPNPATEELTLLGLNEFEVLEVSIQNMQGEKIAAYSDVSTGEFKLDVSKLDAGVYFVSIAHESSVDIIRFIKK